uniref:Uncharacterized protein n=1 Tax=Staphylothermus marinus TaxID=2280 RepID=A0A7C4NMS9_STAMA
MNNLYNVRSRDQVTYVTSKNKHVFTGKICAYENHNNRSNNV